MLTPQFQLPIHHKLVAQALVRANYAKAGPTRRAA